MNKILLTLVGVVSFTGASWGQMWSAPTNLTVPDWPITTPSGTYNPSTNTWVLVEAESGYHVETNKPSYYPPDYPWSPTQEQWVTYQSPDGTKFKFQWYNPGAGYIAIENESIGFQMRTADGFTNPLAANFTNFTPLPWAHLKAQGVTAGSLGPTNWATVGLGPLAVNGGGGGDDGEGSAGAFYTQAQELNVGLEFNNGQWTVKQ
jgi:hypothetical protein